MNDTFSSWSEVTAPALERWNHILATTQASFRQFPFWSQAYRLWGFKPRFFSLGETSAPRAFVAILEKNCLGCRIGLIDRGPFIFAVDTAHADACLETLFQLLRRLRYIFVRFTQGQEEVYQQLMKLHQVHSVEPFPFYRDSRNSLLVELKGGEDEMLASFDKKLRYEIRKGESASYTIRMSTAPQDFEDAWGLFERLAERKGFVLSQKPKAVWLETFKLGAQGGFCRLYLCYLKQNLIAARLNVRDGVVDEDMLSALDLELLADAPSPVPLMVWRAMRDSYASGCRYYNEGGPGDPARNNHVYTFKRKFKPTLKVAPGPVCHVIKPVGYSFWIKVCLPAWRAWRRRSPTRNSRTDASASL